MPCLVQLILPLYDNGGQRFPAKEFAAVRAELVDRFGGLTAYSRAPAEGIWEDADGRARRDDVIVIEVMTDTLDRDWWRAYTDTLATRFAQDEVVIRAITFESLAAPSD